ncbi:MAG: malto-oligosyltrehalose synthase [Chloroflexota bacterium]
MDRPTATYRLQFSKDFRFADAHKLIDYFEALGISHIYASPLLKSRAGSTHGYDVADPTTIDPEIGTEEEFAAFAGALCERGLSILLDIVPNHMAADLENPWWRDVLERGRDSEYARYFDIDWERGGGRIVLPVLAEPLDELLASNSLRLHQDREGTWLEYEEMRLPVAPGTYGGSEALPEVLAKQHYQLEYWRTGAQHLNYRRFFDVTDLVSLREEDPEVFHRAHERVLAMVRDGQVTGLRVDHVDGLRDPKAYLDRLQLAARAQAKDPGDDFYVVIEKIFSEGEELRADWQTTGTTGYEFLNAMNGLFIDPAGLELITETYDSFVGGHEVYEDIAYESKKKVMRDLFAGEMRSLNRRLTELARADPAQSPEDLSHALTEVTAAMRVYRTYIRSTDVSDKDRSVIEEAVAKAHERAPNVPGEAYNFLRRVLTLENPADEHSWLSLVKRWQQFTSPIMAKGIEDTAFYHYVRLLSMNEVGGHPERCMSTPAQFHETNQRSLEHQAGKLNASSTHDTKRSEDVRARLNALSEMPHEWMSAVTRWRDKNAPRKRDVGGEQAPDGREEYAIYQTLVGAWPLDVGDIDDLRGRLPSVIEKMMREEKIRTSWIDPNEEWESEVQTFLQSLFDDADFLEDFRQFQSRVQVPGAVNSLAQVLLKAAAPGVPDTYQGCELWDFSLVDPDNRRPVDFARRVKSLPTLVDATHQDLLASWQDGRIKQFVLQRALRFRGEHAALFADGEYVPLEVAGEHSERVVAFARHQGDEWAVVIAPRLITHLCGDGWPIGEVWGDTCARLLADGHWRNVMSGDVFTGAELLLADAFRKLPVALLTLEPAAAQ